MNRLFPNASLVAKTLIILLLGVLIVAGGAGFGLAGQQQAIGTYHHLVEQELAEELKVNKLNLMLKTQVQEWKNVLLRGSDSKDREKYWGRFEKLQQRIQENAKQLSQEMTQGGQESSLLDAFIAEHASLAPKYRHGYQQFVNANFDPKVGDSAVRGIDRNVSKLLNDLAAQLDEKVKELEHQANVDGERSLIIAVIAMVMCAVVALLFSRQMLMTHLVAPLQQVMTSLSSMAAGKLDKPLAFESHDEMGRLADDVRTLNHTLVSLFDELTASAERLASSSTQLHSSAKGTDEQIDDQRRQVEQIASAITEMSGSAQDVANNVMQVHDNTNSTNQRVGSSQGQLKNSVSALQSLDQTMTQSGDVIGELAKQSEHIGGILDVISNIADQTNLLALNAAIEAARAGEQGRGFAVVADEVRSLASRTTEATDQINTMIGDLQRYSEQAVAAMNNGRQELRQSVDMADKAEVELTAVVSDVNQLTNASHQIALAAEEQGKVSNEVSESLNGIVEVSQRMSSHSGDTIEVASELSAIADQLQARLAQFRLH